MMNPSYRGVYIQIHNSVYEYWNMIFIPVYGELILGFNK